MALNLSKSILDPIYGLVQMTTEELSVIDSPVYQRLRKVKQNGLLHLIWPSATHTRFEHCIGTMFVANSMLSSLLFNSAAAGKQKLRTIGEACVGQAIDFQSIDPSTMDFLFRAARLSALVHDLGHGPFSHTFDTFAPRIEFVRTLLDDPSLTVLKPVRDVLLATRSERVEHEAMSCLFFCSAWQALAPNDLVTPQVVVSAILGRDVFDRFSFSPQERQWVPFLHDLVSSAPADADRMDYLERDSRSLGVTYGLFDRHRLLKSMLCYRSESNGHKEYRLGWKHSGMRAVENFVQARFELFVQVYYHKTNRAISLMLESISKAAAKERLDIFGEVKSRVELERMYCALGDDRFLDMLCGRDGGPLAGLAQINDLAKAIDARRLWKRVYDIRHEGECPSRTDRPKHVEEVLEAVRAKLEETDAGAPLLTDIYDPKATKDLDAGGVLLSRGSDGYYAALPIRSWFDASPIIRVLAEEESSIGRIYLKDVSEDTTRSVKLRRIAMGLSCNKVRQ